MGRKRKDKTIHYESTFEDTPTKKELRRKKMFDLINDKVKSELTTNIRELSVQAYKTLFNIQKDVKFFKSESLSLISRMYSLARMYAIEGDKSYLKDMRTKIEDLRSNFRMMLELNVIGNEATFSMCEAFSKVDNNLNELLLINKDK